MSKQVALIFALLMTSAAADDYRSYREAYAGVDWPKSIASAEQCQQLILSVVRQFGITDAEVRTKTRRATSASPSHATRRKSQSLLMSTACRTRLELHQVCSID
jgi:hypothetical protein